MTSKNTIIQVAPELEDIAMLVQVASRFESKIYLKFGTKTVNAKSIMGMMSLGANIGDSITVAANGADEREALEVLSEYLSRKTV